MRSRDNLPLREGMLRRPRLHSLIQRGTHYPILGLLGGPGYGKTQAMADYLTQCDAQVLWLRLNSLDNLSRHFWSHLLRAVGVEFPGLAARVHTLDLPDTPPRFADFLRALAEEFASHKQVVWVFDDFGELSDPRVLEFFQMLAKTDMPGFCLALLSGVPGGIERLATSGDDLFLITGDDLRFTRQEIAALYAMQGVDADDGEIRRVERYTEGWPLAAHLLVMQHNRGLDGIDGDGALSHGVIAAMFERRFFSAYPEARRRLLVKLSMLPFFTRELCALLYEGDPAELEDRMGHVFVVGEPAMGRFFFHNLYRRFLREKQYLLGPDEEKRVWETAAAYYAALGHPVEAIACRRDAGDFVGMLRAMDDFAKARQDFSARDGEYFLEHLELLTSAQVSEHPLADYLRARAYAATFRLEEAEALLRGLLRRLTEAANPGDESLLGEAYAALGAIRVKQNREDFGDYYKLAYERLPRGTAYRGRNNLLGGNSHIFAMADNLPGAKERMEKAVHRGVGWMAKVMGGGMSGAEHLFSAEAAYLSCELDDAQQHAYRAVYAAEASAQHDTVLNGFCVLARIGLLRGDFEETTRQIRAVSEYAEQFEIGTLWEIRDTALGWYYVKMRDHGRIPKSLLTEDDPRRSALHYGRAQIVCANDLINRGEFARLVGMLEHPKGLYLTRGIGPDRISLFIMLAIGYSNMRQVDAAMDALWTAYDMAHDNGLITQFVEAAEYMRALIALARGQSARPFDPGWLDLIDAQAASFAVRGAAVRAAYAKQAALRMAKNPLTKRETEILRDLAGGLTREEIAVEHFVSVNTVKTFIRSIYNKLNAANRAEAVSIAITKGYIEVSTPE